MAITANAWVDERGRGFITLWSSTGWTDGAWSIQGSLGSLPDTNYTRLYNLLKQTGVGVINGEFLMVTVENCPEGSFLLVTQRGSKRFQLIDGELTFGSSLVGINNLLPPSPYETRSIVGKSTLGKAFLYFGSTLEPFRGRLSAQLQVDGQLHAVIGGNAVDLVSDTRSGVGYWAVPAAIFTDFYWHIQPNGRTSYQFVIEEQRRLGQKGIRSIPVEMDMAQIYSPLGNANFPVAQTNRFEIPLATGLRVSE